MRKKKPVPQSLPQPKTPLPTELASRRDAIFAALQALKVTTVEIKWSGGGDSGQVDEIHAFDKKQGVEIDLEKTDAITVERTFEESIDSGRKKKDGTTIYIQVKKTATETVNLEKEIGSFTEDLWVHFGQDGWWNNEGGYGDMTIDMKKREMHFSHSNYREPIAEVDAEAVL